MSGKCEGSCGLMAIETRTKYVVVNFFSLMAVVRNLCRQCAREWDAKEQEAKAV